VKLLRFPLCFVLAGVLAGCTVGPNYHRAAVVTPAQWTTPEPWRPGAPKDAIPKGEWWKVFQDEDLNALEAKSVAANQTLQGAAARYQQARALTALALSALYPQFSVAPLAERQRISGNRPPSGNVSVLTPVSQTSFLIPFTVGYEVDLFGRRRRTIEASQASLQASAADLENARLVITADLAASYYTLRQLDTELGILQRTVESLEKGLQLVRARHEGGITSGLDVAQEETLLEGTRTQLALLRQQRDAFENSIALLTGQPAPDFHLAAKDLAAEPPPLDAGLPSDLLERRPDVAAAERRMAQANAQIGVARSAYYPSLNLFGNGGWQAADIAKLLNVSSTLWAVGATAAEAILSGGARRAQTQFAKSGYDAAVADYREAVLNSFGEVQSGLSGLTRLQDAKESQARSVAAARRALELAKNRYVGGLVTYLDVVTAQQTLLGAERQAAQIQGERLVTSVQLVKALGGGWDASSLAAARIKPLARTALAP
jgi:outer membrane protein, multidrug efflux system